MIRGAPWSRPENTFLRENYGTMPSRALAKALHEAFPQYNRSPKAIRTQAAELGLAKKLPPPPPKKKISHPRPGVMVHKLLG